MDWINNLEGVYMRPTHVEINLAAIKHNMAQIKKAAPGTHIMAVVKANAYGHGAVEISRAALDAGADMLAVAIPEEGAELRHADITAPILVLGLSLKEQAPLLIKNHLIAAVCDMANAQALAQAAKEQNTVTPVFIKVDTGMGRIGIPQEKVLPFAKNISTLPNLKLKGIFTHLASADADDKNYANKQLAIIKKTVDTLRDAHFDLTYISAANSAAIIDLPSGHFNTVRPGIILYGLPPSHEMHHSLDLKPVMEFKTRITYIKKVPAGSSISYGCTYTTPQETYIATIPVGYADGYSRALSNKADVLIGGKRYRVVGRVCMDQIMVDLGPECSAQIGDEVVLFGKQLGAEITATELADLTDTINYEILCDISPRVPRVYLYKN